MNDICIDLETMSTQPDAPIVGLGAVEFDLQRGLIGKTFYRCINLADSVQKLGPMEDGTVAFWLAQSKAAQNAIIHSSIPVGDGLQEFSDWLANCAKPEDIRMWGNGVYFDNVVLSHAYWKMGIPQPWRFWNDRCYRTLKALYQECPADAPVGEKHNSIDDAMNQVRHIIKIRNHVVRMKR